MAKEKIGALWQNKDRNGNTYFSGSVTLDGVETKIVVFTNSYKEEEKHPDFIIYPKGENTGTQERQKPVETQDDDLDDDIPF